MQASRKKICLHCGKTKPLKKFYHSGMTSDYHNDYCIKCLLDIDKEINGSEQPGFSLQLQPKSTSPHALLRALQKLRKHVKKEGLVIVEQWQKQIKRPEYLASALNLAQYLVFRRHDLRAIQIALMPWGLSSLERIDAGVMPKLDAVISTLKVISGRDAKRFQPRPPIESFFEGNQLLKQQTEALLGSSTLPHRVRIMVTLPGAAATDYALVQEFVKRGANCMRINCAHDSPELWQAMINHVRQAEQEFGCQCKIMMDLAGLKIRTATVLAPLEKKRVFIGDYIVLRRRAIEVDNEGQPHKAIPVCIDDFHLSCTMPEVLDLLALDALVTIDDGRIQTRVIETQYDTPDGGTGLLLQVTNVHPGGVKLRPEKGLGFPGALLPFSPLTEKDLSDLDFIAAHADIVGFSFVQSASDIDSLQKELNRRARKRRPKLAIVASIDPATALGHLPEIIIRAAGKQSFGLMIASGEIGCLHLAESQEEFLGLCQAAHVPVIWRAQVLDHRAKNAAPSLSEMSDSTLAERVQCIMLDERRFIAEAITALNEVLTRMEVQRLKRTPQLRALRS